MCLPLLYSGMGLYGEDAEQSIGTDHARAP